MTIKMISMKRKIYRVSYAYKSVLKGLS